MRKVAVVGAGKIGAVIAETLAQTRDYAVTVVDQAPVALRGVKAVQADISDPAALDAVLADAYAVLSAAPFHLTAAVAEAAARTGCHYLDLTEDVATTRRVKELARGAKSAFIPQCGLAPGFVSIVGASLARKFDSLDTLRLRVGALPRYAANSLGYNLTWSTDGVVNEYCEPCEVVIDGVRREAPALEELESFVLDGMAYEAFNTSGGLGSLAEVLDGKVQNLNYKTIRYPGHCALMRTLLGDLGLRRRRHLLKDILEGAVPQTPQDVVVVFVTATGERAGRLTQESWAARVMAGPWFGIERTAIQITTAAGIMTVLDLLAAGRLPQSGFVRQEEIELEEFLANRFGRAYLGEVEAVAPAALVA